MTNILQTTANKTETNTNIWPTNRKRQMVWLSLLTACTLVGQYMMLGETGLSKKILGGGFEWVELGLWGGAGIGRSVYCGLHRNDKNQQRTRGRRA